MSPTLRFLSCLGLLAGQFLMPYTAEARFTYSSDEPFPVKTTVISNPEVQPQTINLAYGTPIWFQIPAENVARAKKFYQNVFHWEFPDLPGPPPEFMVQFRFPEKRMHQPGVTNGGIVKVDPKDHFKVDTTNLLSYRGLTHMYFFVKSIDQTLKLIEKEGGKALGGKQSEDPTSNVAHFIDTEGNAQALYETLECDMF